MNIIRLRSRSLTIRFDRQRQQFLCASGAEPPESPSEPVSPERATDDLCSVAPLGLESNIDAVPVVLHHRLISTALPARKLYQMETQVYYCVT